MTAAFLTGSHVYGTPNEKSDVDLVIFVNNIAEIKPLMQMVSDHVTDMSKEDEYHGKGLSIKLGKLNLLFIDDLTVYNAWRQCTDVCIDIARIRSKRLNKLESELLFRNVIDLWESPLRVIEDNNLLSSGNLTYAKSN